MAKRRCGKCEEFKPDYEFYKRGKSGRQSWCKVCFKLRETAWWNSWHNMVQRCENPNNPKYDDYGRRGIKIDPAIRSSADFHKYMGDRPDGTTLDRIDPNGNYEPGNLRWATHSEQNLNKRNSKKWACKPSL